MKNHPLSCLALVLILGSLLGWRVANEYAPNKIMTKARVFSPAKACDEECILLVTFPPNDLRAVTVSDDEFYALAGRGKEGVYVTEEVEWITGKHIRWHIEAIIINSNSLLKEG